MSKIVWVTGRVNTGKTTLAKRLCAIHDNAVLLDSDVFRKMLGFDGYTKKDRDRWVYTMAKLAKELHSQGFMPIVAIISPYKKTRKYIFKKILGKRNVVLVYLPGGEDRMWKGSVYEEPTKEEASIFIKRQQEI